MSFLSSLFGSTPRWLQESPPHLKFSSPGLVQELEALRKRMGIGHSDFARAILCSRVATKLVLKSVYDQFKSDATNETEKEIAGLVFSDRVMKEAIALRTLGAAADNGARFATNQLIENFASIQDECTPLEKVQEFFVVIGEARGAFDDEKRVIAQVDAVIAKFKV